MSNRALSRQDTQQQLKRLIAARRLYSFAKRVLAWQIVVTAALVVVWSTLEAVLHSVKPYAALYGIVAIVLDLTVFTPWQDSLKRKAAGIQELFDCEVLQLPWQEIKTGPPPETETVVEWSKPRVGSQDEETRVSNWYPLDAWRVPLHIGRIVCQRANCWWDAKLRRRYSVWILVATSAIFGSICLIGLVEHMTLEQFLLAGVVPFVPVLMIGIREGTSQRQSATRLDELKRHSERLWIDALSRKIPEEELTRRSRTLQDELYQQRRRNPLIFDWVYERLRIEQEEVMNRTAVELLQEASEKLSGT